MEEDRLITADTSGDDGSFDLSLRPKVLTEYVGQSKAKENLKVFIGAAKGRGESLDHVLFYGPPVADNPWGGATLEWLTTSPPPTENFAADPVVRHGPYDFKKAGLL